MSEEPKATRFAFFYLDGDHVTEGTMEDWVNWAVRRGNSHFIAQDQLGPLLVSTVLLPGVVVHEGQTPKPFETMILGSGYGPMWRCATLKQAMQQHRAAIEQAKVKLQ